MKNQMHHRRVALVRHLRKPAFACLAAGLMLSASLALAAPRNLQRIDTFNLGPVYIDRDSIQRTGSSVRFLYILDLPTDYTGADETRRWKSNEIDMVIDCAAKTEAFMSVRGYSGAAASGSVNGGYTPSASESKPEKITTGSTTDAFFNYLCRQ